MPLRSLGGKRLSRSHLRFLLPRKRNERRKQNKIQRGKRECAQDHWIPNDEPVQANAYD